MDNARLIDPLSWRSLTEELDQWAALGHQVRFWWRDDDAVSVTPQLDRLTALCHDFQAPVLLAVIPAFADDGLAAYLKSQPLLSAAVHGWRHDNHAQPSEKSCEFAKSRGDEDMRADLAAGQERISALFGAEAGSRFVPPWNRYAPRLEALLAETGFALLSASGAPGLSHAPSGLAKLTVEIDPIDWHGNRSLLPLGDLVALIADKCKTRRQSARFHEPIGFMTHHLVHDAAIWAFTEAFLRVITEHPGSLWLSAPALLSGHTLL